MVTNDAIDDHAVALSAEEIERIIAALLRELNAVRKTEAAAGESLGLAIAYWHAVLRDVRTAQRAVARP
jgi:hypothetical protein